MVRYLLIYKSYFLLKKIMSENIFFKCEKLNKVFFFRTKTKFLSIFLVILYLNNYIP